MRFGLKVLLFLVVLGVLAAGLLPPAFYMGHLRDNANAAAKAGAAVLLNPGNGSPSVNQAVSTSIAAHRGLKLSSVKVDHGVVTVVVKQNVHSFMSGLPGLEHWFNLTVTESASAFGASG